MAFRGFASPAQDPDSAQQKNSQHAEQVRDALNVQMTSAAPYSGLGKDPVQLKDHAPQPRFEVKDSRYIVSSYEEDEFGLAEDSSGMDSDRYSGHNPQEQDDFDEMDRPQYDYEDGASQYSNYHPPLALSSYATSVSPSVLEYQYENGRRYHCYREGEYVLPNDEKEQDRLDLLHHIFRMILSGELHWAPVTNPKRILDLGTGTGIWAIDMADEFPDAQVIANDLSAIQPSNVPPNLTFEIDDVESPWPYSKPFDFIHTRALAGAVTDWPKLYSQAFEHLTPGGYFEATDFRMKPYSEDGREDFIMREMSDYFAEALKVIGKPADVAHLHKQGMVDAGFINVKERVEVVPYSAWPADKKARLLGMYHMHSIIDAIHSYGLAPLVRILGMPRTEAEVLLATARAEVMNPNMRLYSLLHFVVGQKPEDAGMAPKFEQIRTKGKEAAQPQMNTSDESDNVL